MTKEQRQELTDKTNRSESQTDFLYELVDKDFDKLAELERKILENNIAYCPGNVTEVNRILNLKNHD